jgi:hypothetical protein
LKPPKRAFGTSEAPQYGQQSISVKDIINRAKENQSNPNKKPENKTHKRSLNGRFFLYTNLDNIYLKKDKNRLN